MIAVVSEMSMTPGYRVFPIAYFAKQRPPVEQLTANWPRKIHAWKTPLGQKGWNFPNDVWDFELLPWAQKDKLRWCPPGSNNASLSHDRPDQCPYLKIKGERTRFIVEGDHARKAGLPDGSVLSPLDVG